MSPLVLTLVLASALLHASWNAMLRSGADRLWSISVMCAMSGLASAAIVPFVPLPAPGAWPFVFLSAALQVGYCLFLVRAYRDGLLAQVYPIARGSAPPLVALAAFLLPTHQTLSLIQMAGVISISAGILSLAVERPVDRAHKWEAIAFGLLTGLTIMAYTLFDGEGIRHAGETERQQLGYIVWLFVLDSPLLVIYCFVQRGAEVTAFVRRNWKLGLCGAALSLAAYGIAIIAMRFGEFAHVSALRETSVIFAALMSAYLLKERFRKRRYVSVTLVALGAVLLH